jgi:hypothetical protein
MSNAVDRSISLPWEARQPFVLGRIRSVLNNILEGFHSFSITRPVLQVPRLLQLQLE